MKNYHIDLYDFIEAMLSDLRKSTIIVDAKTKRMLRDYDEVPREVMAKITALAEEYLWYRLAEGYSSIPETMTALFEKLAYELQYVPDSSAPVPEVVDDFVTALRETEQVYNQYMEYLPENRWAMVEMTVVDTFVTITFGKDLRIHLFEAQYGKGRWANDPVPIPRHGEVYIGATLGIDPRGSK